MAKINLMRLYLLAMAWSGLQAGASVTLFCDFSNADFQRAPMRCLWDVSNRISPGHGFNMPAGENPLICVVRPLGGKSRDGKKLIDQDTYKWDGGQYVYDWAPLKTQIDTVQAKARIFQLMIDNPPWAFQRGIDFQGEKDVETYGNAWPPNDPDAWAAYIQEMLKELVKTYGMEQVQQWRFCIGREIGTAGHWRGSMQEFFKHYANTVKAIHSVLPGAKVGAHFLWASSKHSYGPEFVKWCRKNNVHYDFIGVSYYPFYHRTNRVDMDHVYRVDFAPIKDIPEWNPNAALEIHEFALIKNMSKKGNSFEKAPKAHLEAFTVMLGKMMYEHGLVRVFRWGTGEDKLAEQALLSMKGNLYYASSKEGESDVSGAMVDAIFAWDKTNNQYNVLAYNYNADPGSTKSEAVKVSANLPTKPGTLVKYREGLFEGRALEWSGWKTGRTKAVSGGGHSRFELDIKLPAFSFCKIEIKGSKPPGTNRVLTDRKDGTRVEVELGSLKKDRLICYAKGRRFVIPVSSLTDEDQEFLRKWARKK